MAKGKRASGDKGTKITLKMAKNAMRVTLDGKVRLDLSNVGISTFPKCLLKLRNIQELDLSRNKLKTIPEFIGQFTGLLWLDLHSNHIEQLPESIGRLASLVHLNLCNNKIDSITPEIGGLRSLQVLNLGMNRLTTLPPTLVALTNLTELGLFDNLLTKVPDRIHALPNLEKLNAKRNPVEYTLVETSKPCDSVKMTENLYLVSGDDLCQPCLERCKEERQRFMKNKSCDHRSQRKTNFSGLITPNSVAQGNQEIWRQQTISP